MPSLRRWLVAPDHAHTTSWLEEVSLRIERDIYGGRGYGLESSWLGMESTSGAQVRTVCNSNRDRRYAGEDQPFSRSLQMKL